MDHVQAKTGTLQSKGLAEEIKNLPPPAHVMVGRDLNIDSRGPNLGDSREEYLGVTQLHEPNWAAVGVSFASGDQH